jgi:hypothetical protein
LEVLIDQVNERLSRLDSLSRRDRIEQDDDSIHRLVVTHAPLEYSEIKSLVERELEKFASDRVGMPDFALASTGARVVNSLTSPSFYPNSKFAWISRLRRISFSKRPEVALNVGIL